MEDEDSIELIDYLRVVWKWKWFIITFTLICSVVAVIISFSMLEIYEVSMLIEPGVIDFDPDGKFIYLDSASNIKSKIDSQAYNNKISKRLDAKGRKLTLKFETAQAKDSNTVRVVLKGNDVGKAIQALSALFDELTKEYQHYVDSRKSELEQKIAMNKSQLDINTNEKKRLQSEINMVKATTDRIVEERSMLIKEGGKNLDKLSLLIYTNTIQQNMTHYNYLTEQLGWLMTKIEETKSEIEALNIKKQSIENIKLIQPPQSSIYPIKPKKKLNVILAFVIGLIFSIFLAFFLEYLQKVKIQPEFSKNREQTASFKNEDQ